MFAVNSISLSKMNHSAKYSAFCVSLPMGCNDSLMSFMPMIMRQPLGSVFNHVV